MQRLNQHFGPRHWWPAETAFEVVVGAVLTQNTAWVNVERAIGNLRHAEALNAEAILNLPEPALAALIKPSGYFNVKAKRLRAACYWWQELHSAGGATQLSTEALRESVLATKGIGPETADDILLYAFDRPVFVVDAYTRRSFQRLGLPHFDRPYEELRAWVEAALAADVPELKQAHALLVELGKHYCRPKPRCEACPLTIDCPRLGV